MTLSRAGFLTLAPGNNFSSKEQVSFNFVAAVTICSDFGAQENSLLPGASVRNPARDKVMRKEADIRKACSDFRGPSGNS